MAASPLQLPPLLAGHHPSAKGRSGRCYIRLAQKDVAMARFELEAHGHLGVFSVLDRWDCLAVITYAPDMQAELGAYLEALKELVEYEVVYEHPRRRPE